jgi:hypothetical protein
MFQKEFRKEMDNEMNPGVKNTFDLILISTDKQTILHLQKKCIK